MLTPTYSPARIDLDVTAAVGVGENLRQAAWLFPPNPRSKLLGALVCFPGGTYDKHYWHLAVEAHPGYSFAEYFANSGYVVVAVDHLGVGESSDLTMTNHVGTELLARGNAAVARQIREMLCSGALVEDLMPVDVPLIGVGHSLGAAVTAMVQADTAAFDGLVLLGYPVMPQLHATSIQSTDMEAAAQQSFESFCQAFEVDPSVGTAVLNRQLLAPLFYTADVPEPVIRADEAVESRVPIRAASEIIVPGFLADYTRRIDIPVFLGFGGAVDVVADPYLEPKYYQGSPDVTLHMVPGSAHCHNLASSRQQLWRRIAIWLAAIEKRPSAVE